MNPLSHPETSSTPIPANHSPAAESPAPPNPVPLPRRLSRVGDYLVASLEKTNPLDANLGSLNSGLMEMALRLETMILQGLANGLPLVSRHESLMPALEVYLRLTRQVDRFSNLERQRAEPVAKAAGRKRLTPPAQETSQRPSTSNESGPGSSGHGGGGL